MNRFLFRLTFALLIVAASGTSARAELETLDAGGRHEIVESVAEILIANHVFPDVAERLAARIRAHRDAGRYDDVEHPSDLADRLTLDLLAEEHDGHLRIVPPNPDGSLPGGARLGGGQQVRLSPGSSGGSEGGQRRVRMSGGSGGGSAGGGTRMQVGPDFRMEDLPPEIRQVMEERRRAERLKNSYFSKIEILPGNIGYIKYDQFGFPQWSRETAVAAFEFVKDTDAIILDVRNNPGGVGGMNQFLCSFFFDEEVHLYSRYHRVGDSTQTVSSLTDHPGPQRPDVPLFVLTARTTGSAAENLSFSLQSVGRATLVGDRTAGGAHSARVMPAAHNFAVQVPIARVFDPRTNEDWEGDGVQPDVWATDEDPLIVAHGLAVDGLMEEREGEARDLLAMAKGQLRAQRGEAIIAPEALADYQGQYGARRLWVENETLYLQRSDRPDAPPLELMAVADDAFVLVRRPSVSIRFDRDDAGQVVRIRLQNPLGGWMVSERDAE